MGGPLPGVLDLIQLYSGWTVGMNGQGGTGYLNPGPNPSYAGVYARADRVAAMAAFEPEVILFASSDNDIGQGTPSQIATAATNCWDDYAEEVGEGTPFVVVGVPNGNRATALAINDALRTAAAAHDNVVAFFDPVAEGWVVDGVLGPDASHCRPIGNEHLAVHYYQAVRHAMQNVVGDTRW